MFSFAEPGMRVGREFQAIIPDLVSESMLQLLYVYVLFLTIIMTNCCYSFSSKPKSVIMESSSLFPGKKLNDFVLILTDKFKPSALQFLKCQLQT